MKQRFQERDKSPSLLSSIFHGSVMNFCNSSTQGRKRFANQCYLARWYGQCLNSCRVRCQESFLPRRPILISKHTAKPGWPSQCSSWNVKDFSCLLHFSFGFCNCSLVDVRQLLDVVVEIVVSSTRNHRLRAKALLQLYVVKMWKHIYHLIQHADSDIEREVRHATLGCTVCWVMLVDVQFDSVDTYTISFSVHFRARKRVKHVLFNRTICSP